MADRPAFTSGPWTTTASIQPWAAACVMGKDGLAIAHVVSASDVPLLKAAPDLFEALTKVEGSLFAVASREIAPDALLRDVRAALSKALGEQPL